MKKLILLLVGLFALSGCTSDSIKDIDVSNSDPSCVRDCSDNHSLCVTQVGIYKYFVPEALKGCREAYEVCVNTCPEKQSEIKPPFVTAAEKELIKKLAGDFVFVQGGCFEMGCGGWSSNCISGEEPVHEVCVDGFYIGKYEVTQSQWQNVMGSNPSNFQKGDNYPVEQVSWEDTQEFIRRLNNKTGKNFRLPSEAEWEYACRSGGKKEKYCGGNKIDAVAWYGGNSVNNTHPVGTRSPNGLGLYDMSGNVWEWVSDWYDKGYYGRSPRSNPQGPSLGSERVVRGGSWNCNPRYIRASDRDRSYPDIRYSILGFRLVSPGQ